MEDGESTAEAGAAASADRTPVSETSEVIGSGDDSGDESPAETPPAESPKESPPTKTPEETPSKTPKESPPAETPKEAPVSPAPVESPKPGAGSSSEGESSFWYIQYKNCYCPGWISCELKHTCSFWNIVL